MENYFWWINLWVNKVLIENYFRVDYERAKSISAAFQRRLTIGHSEFSFRRATRQQQIPRNVDFYHRGLDVVCPRACFWFRSWRLRVRSCQHRLAPHHQRYCHWAVEISVDGRALFDSSEGILWWCLNLGQTRKTSSAVASRSLYPVLAFYLRFWRQHTVSRSSWVVCSNNPVLENFLAAAYVGLSKRKVQWLDILSLFLWLTCSTKFKTKKKLIFEN